MPKAEKGSAKDLANRMKSRGLQKLKFYCQMCEKQCRDANGFKCHLTSETHLRNMKIFSDNAGGILDQYSKDFESSYLTALRMRHGTKLVNANNVYQEMIADKRHIHMNATHWTTLTDCIQYLGKTGKCVVEETDRGWFVSYIQRDASILAQQESQQRREAADRAAEMLQAQRMKVQREEAAKALDRAGGTMKVEATSIMDYTRRDGQQRPTIQVSLTSKNSAAAVAAAAATLASGKAKKKASASISGVFDDDEDDGDEGEEEEAFYARPIQPQIEAPSLVRQPTPMASSSASRNGYKIQGKKNNNSEDNDSQKKRKESSNGNINLSSQQHKRAKMSGGDDCKTDSQQQDYWLYRDIIVRVISKSLAGGKYFRRKAVVDKLVDKYTAEVEVLDSGDGDAAARGGGGGGGDILRLDQSDLETVVPKIKPEDDDNKKKKRKARKVRVLVGKYRGSKAVVVALDKKKYQADLTLLLDDGDKELRNVPYEHFSQLA